MKVWQEMKKKRKEYISFRLESDKRMISVKKYVLRKILSVEN